MINNEQRIQNALRIAEATAQLDGAHHKMWTIDQMVRALTGCELIGGKLVGNDEYFKFVLDYEEPYGPDSYYWDTGIPA